MSDFRVIVIGTSAGGLDVLRGLVRDLPRDLNAAIFIVMHMSPEANSRLPEILARESRMPVEAATDQGAIHAGRIYCCVPDRHLLVHPGYMATARGPRENRHRPSIDALFRSAARAYGARCVGVLLTGLLDDGTAGLISIRRQGGAVIVQDPEDAEFAAMPQNALRFVKPDRVLPAAEILAALMELCGRKMPTLVAPDTVAASEEQPPPTRPAPRSRPRPGPSSG